MSVDKKDDVVFEIGEDAIFAMRSQEFEADELGTIVARPPKRPAPQTVTVASEVNADLPERFGRLEHRIAQIQEFLRSLETRFR